MQVKTIEELLKEERELNYRTYKAMGAYDDDPQKALELYFGKYAYIRKRNEEFYAENGYNMGGWNSVWEQREVAAKLVKESPEKALWVSLIKRHPDQEAAKSLLKEIQ